MRYLLPVFAILPLLASCAAEGPAIGDDDELKLAVNVGDSWTYDVRIDAVTTPRDSVQSAAGAGGQASLISGPIELSVDTTSPDKIRWYYDMPQMIMMVEGAEPQRVPTQPMMFTTNYKGRTMDASNNRIPVRISGIGGMVHYNAQQLFLPDMIGAHKAGDTWTVDEVDSASGGDFPTTNTIKREITYRGTVDTLGRKLALVHVSTELFTVPRQPQPSADGTTPRDTIERVPAMHSTILTESDLYYSMDDKLLYMLDGTSAVIIHEVSDEPFQRSTIQMVRQK